MLAEFMMEHREEILARTRGKVAARMAPRPTESEIEHGVPLFVDQLIDTLKAQEPRGVESDAELGRSAEAHGGDRLRAGFTVNQLVHDYGDVCQAVTELAVDLNARISTDDFRTLNKCLDFAIGRAVLEFERQRECYLSERETERSGSMAHEMRNILMTANIAFFVLKQGKVGITGSTGAALERALDSLSKVVDRSIAIVRNGVGAPVRERVLVSDLMEEIQVTATIEASNGGFALEVSPVDPELELETDRLLLLAALTNLLRNAFKFSKPSSTIILRAFETADNTLHIEVEDECGGLALENKEELFQPFVQLGINRSGLGLGLSISRESVRAIGGELGVRNLPGKGCVFSVDLPLRAPTEKN